MKSRFIIHNPNTEEETMRIASLLLMSANLSDAIEIVSKELLPDQNLPIDVEEKVV